MKRKILLVFLTVVLITGGLLSCGKGPKKTDEQYDYNNNLVAVSDLQGLTAAVRGVGMIVLDVQKQIVFEQLTLGYIYSEKYVIVPNVLFFVPTANGRVDISESGAGYTIRVFLLPDSGDDWKAEELKGMVFRNSDFAVIERANPALVPKAKYMIGAYDDLKMGNFLYLITQENGAIGIKTSEVTRLHMEKNKNLISSAGNYLYQEWGGLAFALRKGKPELVGMFVVIGEQIIGEQGMVFAHFSDINQIIEEIEKLN
ncbi:MAG: hypothetical protein HYW69_01305 [Candidatus Nealsonbacteria bacterium]|nr:hypothetical protein [Candidatus Nealsonbacteria bacterium]